jgi:cytochrome b pre-mRNA-processing protein 3
MALRVFRQGATHRQTTAAQALYACIVAQARQPEFFADLGVPDHLDGRFETLALHAFLVLRRIKAEPTDEAGDLAQALFDIFFVDMDRSLREMGASDLGVGRRVKAMAEGLYGRIQAYERGLMEGGAVLEPALKRNLYGTVAEPRADDLASLARYLKCQDRALAAQPMSEFRAGRIAFLPVVQAIAARSPNDPG